ncbi:MAG: glycosyltransferase family 2 protein [Gammaproteobacteria bacterium]|nr:glycosyltransferase family 2 protein [Gammaproteobacteria bacterium]
MVDTIPENNPADCKGSSTQVEMPLVSIGMPVFNEAKYIERSLRALLDQDYPNFEIIISDNGSDDETFAIIERIILAEKKVSLHRFDTNQGAMINVQYIMKHAAGKYFMWASGHDLWSENLVSECVSLLEKQPNAIVAYGSPVWIDGQDEIMDRPVGWTDTRGLDIVGKFMAVFWGSMNPVLGVIRRNALPDMDDYYKGVGVDLIILLELILKGDFLHAHKAEFLRRQPRKQEAYSEKLARYKSDDLKMTTSLFGKLFPLFRMPYEIIRLILKAKIGFGSKIAILLILIPAFPIRYIMGRQSR